MHIVANDLCPSIRRFTDQALTDLHFQSDRGFALSFTWCNSTGTKMKLVIIRFERKERNVIIIKGLLDEFGHLRGKVIDIKHIRDLGADLAHQVQLAQAELFHFGAMRSEQVHRDDLPQSLEQV